MEVFAGCNSATEISAVFPSPSKLVHPIPSGINGAAQGIFWRRRIGCKAEASGFILAPGPSGYGEDINPELLPGFDHVALRKFSKKFGFYGIEKKGDSIGLFMGNGGENPFSRIHEKPPLSAFLLTLFGCNELKNVNKSQNDIRIPKDGRIISCERLKFQCAFLNPLDFTSYLFIHVLSPSRIILSSPSIITPPSLPLY
jgi:hypothetical protein